MPCSKGEIGFAAAHVRKDQFMIWQPVHPASLFCQMRKDLQVMIDLPMLVRHRGANLSRGIRDFEPVQPILSGSIQKLPLCAVMAASRGRGESRFMADQSHFASLF